MYRFVENELKKANITCPCTAYNGAGELVIIEHDDDFYRLMTVQDNGWLRINEYYKDGTITETYER